MSSDVLLDTGGNANVLGRFLSFHRGDFHFGVGKTTDCNIPLPIYRGKKNPVISNPSPEILRMYTLPKRQTSNLRGINRQLWKNTRCCQYDGGHILGPSPS